MSLSFVLLILKAAGFLACGSFDALGV